MAAIPKVKVTFDADLDGLKRGTNQAAGEVEGFGGKVEKFGKMAAAAFAAAAAAAATYAIKLGVDGVKAAIEDEQAQSKLAQTLKAAAGATDQQVAATEKFISTMQLATGVADTDLRNAMGRLTLSTNDVKKSQELLTLALDISKARGLSLETVSNALGKAYDGQTTSLGKLGIGLSSAELKGKSFNEVQGQLNELFGGAAAKNAETYQGRIDRLKQAFEETKETIGVALLPILDKLLQFVTTYILPVFEKFSNAFAKDKGGLNAQLDSTVTFLKDFFIPIWDAFKDAFNKVRDAIVDNGDKIKDWLENYKEIYAWAKEYILPFIQKILVNAIQELSSKIELALRVIIPVVKFISDQVKLLFNGIISTINAFIDAYNLLNGLWGGSDVKKIKLIGEQTTPIYGAGNPNLMTGGSKGAGGGSTGSVVVTTPAVTIPSTPTITTGTGKTTITTPTITAGYRGTSGTPVFDPGSFRIYENADMQTGITATSRFNPSAFRAAENASITINVNAPSVIDEQGFSNAVVDALNNATYRGTRLTIA